MKVKWFLGKDDNYCLYTEKLLVLKNEILLKSHSGLSLDELFPILEIYVQQSQQPQTSHIISKHCAFI